MPDQLSYQHIAKYASIAFPVAFAGIPIYLFLPEYYHSQFSLSLTTLGLALFFLRILDAMLDPCIGWYCDRYLQQPIKTVMLIAMVFMFGFYLLCRPLFNNILLNLIIGVFLTTSAFSFFTIFLNSRGALWRQDMTNKSRIISVREGTNIIGVLVAALLPFSLQVWLSKQQAYLIYAIIFIIIMLLSLLFFTNWLKNNPSPAKITKNQQHSYLAYIKQCNRQGGILFLSYSLSATGSAIPAVMLVFYSKYVLQSSNLTGLYLFLYFLAALISIPLCKRLALQFGMAKCWQYAIFAAIAIFIFTWWLQSGDQWLFALISFLSGACFAAEILLPNILLAQFIDHPKRRHLGNGFYALLAFIGKFSFALATLIALSLLEKSTLSILTIKILYCLLPCFFKLLAAISLHLIKPDNYRLNRKYDMMKP